MNHILLIITFITFWFVTEAQLNLPLRFENNEAKWTELSWIEGNVKEDQRLDMSVPPVIVEDTIYLFMNYIHGILENGRSYGYCGYSIKKLNIKTGYKYWETRRIYKEYLVRKLVSHAFLRDNKLIISLQDEGPQHVGPGTNWDFCYPGHAVLNISSGQIIDSNYVNKMDTSLLPVFGLGGTLSSRVNQNPKIYTRDSGYEYRRYRPGVDYFHKIIFDFEGKPIFFDTIEFKPKYTFENLRYYETPDDGMISVMVSQKQNWYEKEVIMAKFDKEMNLTESYDLTQHFSDSIGFCVAERFDNDYIITLSGLEDFDKRTLRLTYHMFDTKAGLIDKLTYILRDGIDNGIMYGHFYPLVDKINNRILLTRSRQDTITEGTYYDIFVSSGDTISLLKRTYVEGIKDHFRTQYATMSDDGDLLLYLFQFSWNPSPPAIAPDYPRFNSWVLLDGQKMNIISSTNDDIYAQQMYQPFPNPFYDQLHMEYPGYAYIRIMDITGKVMTTRQIEPGKISIDTSTWTSGMYIIHVQNKDGLASSFKVIKQ